MNGIQPGTTAQSDKSLKIDKIIRDASLKAYNHIAKENPKLYYQRKLLPNQIPGEIGACQPDGLIWFYESIPIIAIEAKHQGARGNAIERWYKNNFILRTINPQISYLTFASGKGTLPRNPIWTALHVAHLDGYNKIIPFKNSVFLSEDGFTVYEVCNLIIDLFNLTIERYDNDEAFIYVGGRENQVNKTLSTILS